MRYGLGLGSRDQAAYHVTKCVYSDIDSDPVTRLSGPRDLPVNPVP